ncbi:hypothetical protein F5Y04DRAFT_220079 [Hypomontagnella monticulosa]|nr:hypothetical protein F5Y04DRAFT_220079 [Hypomontagnella monticulosa]
MARLPVDHAIVTRYCKAFSEPPKKPDARMISDLLEVYRSMRDFQNIRNSMVGASHTWSCHPVGILLMAIDPSTGNSALHVAAASKNLEGLRAVNAEFRPLQVRLRKPYHMLVSHKNHAGDTMLHVAARTGDVQLLVYVYRIFCHDFLPGEKHSGSNQPVELQSAEGLDQFIIPRLAFLIDKNNQGRDAIAEAELMGHQEAVEWLEALVSRMDPSGKRNDAVEKGKVEDYVRNLYQYDQEEAEPETGKDT